MKSLLFMIALMGSSSQLFASVVNVTIENMKFNPAVVEVQAGDEIVFTNLDRAPHSVVTNDERVEGSGLLRTDDTFTITIADDVSSFAIKCGVHPHMPGVSVNVAQVGGKNAAILSKIELLLSELKANLANQSN